jgi:hypothetical protein
MVRQRLEWMMPASALSDLNVRSGQKDPTITTEQPKEDGDPVTP